MTLQEQLYDKLQKEYDSFIEEIKGLPPDEIIEKSYEKVYKEELLSLFYDDKRDDEEAQALLDLEYPLEELYQEWMDTDASISETLEDVIYYKIRRLLAEKSEKVPEHTEVDETPIDILPTSKAVNGELRVEDWVVSMPDDEYGCLIGMVTAIDKKGTPEHGTENVGDDIHVDFITDTPYPPDRIEEIEERFSEAYGELKTIDDIPLDNVIMAPDMLVRVTGIHLDDLSRLVNDYEAAEAFCNEFTESGKSNRQKEIMLDELTNRVEKNYTDYLESLQGFGTNELIDMASKIHAVSDAYSYLAAYHDFDVHELEFFLQFQNPLEVVADEWRDRNIDVGAVSDVIEYQYGNSDDLLQDYPLMSDIDAPIDTSLRRCMDVDLFLYLGKIAEKTIIHYPNDWKYDMEELLKFAESDDINDKRLIWHVCSTGTHLKRECDVFIKETGAYEYMTDYHQNDPDMFGFVVEITGTDGNNNVVGNIFEVGNYAEYAQHIRKVAEPIESVALFYSDEWGVNAGKMVTVSRKEYDDDRHRLMSESGNVKQIVYLPQDKVRLAALLVAERSRRMSYPLGSTGALLRKMAEKLKEVRKPPEKAEQTAEKPKKSFEDKLKSAQERADAHNATRSSRVNAQKNNNKTQKKKGENEL